MMMRNESLVCLFLGLAVTVVGCDDPAEELAGDPDAESADIVDDVVAAVADAGDKEEAAEPLPLPLAAPPTDPDASTLWHSASPACVTTGGGTWGSILKLCVSFTCDLNGVEKGHFTVTKKDGSQFTTPGTLYLRQDSYNGKLHKSTPYYSGASQAGVTDTFYQWAFPGGRLDYYAYLASSGGGYAWVGPLRVYEHISP